MQRIHYQQSSANVVRCMQTRYGGMERAHIALELMLPNTTIWSFKARQQAGISVIAIVEGVIATRGGFT